MNLMRWNGTLAALGAVMIGAHVASAQGKCEFEESKPRALPIAGLSLSKGSMSKDPAERAKNFREVIRTLSDPKMTENPEGRAWYMGQAIASWMGDPGMPPSFITTRSAVGFSDNPDAKVDLVVLVDSLFSIIEKSQPGCMAQTGAWRAQRPWFSLVQAAFAQLQANNSDSAAKLAERSRILNRQSAYGPYVLGQVAANKKDLATMRTMLTEAARLAGTDTNFTDIKRRALLTIARNTAEIAERAQGADKEPATRTAVADLRAFLAEAGTDPDAVPVRGMLADMLITLKDTLGVVGLYGDILANPAKYNDYEKVSAGVTMTRLNRTAEASRLFELALEQNPNQRDALNNSAATYYSSKKYKEMLPVAQRLTALDPNNPDNWLWFAYAYQGIGSGYTGKDAASVKLRKAYTDSVVKYQTKADNLPVKVTFANFFRGINETSLQGTVENRGKAAKSMTFAVEFLDKDGNAMGSGEAKLDAVGPGQSKDFKVVLPKGGVLAFRYKAIE
ncbi:MAG: hypothetical protein HY275_02880 [Gemmatimonadetes bacterium]|nr:hypothetical protein [Gemmatimonadota bacterium]